MLFDFEFDKRHLSYHDKQAAEFEYGCAGEECCECICQEIGSFMAILMREFINQSYRLHLSKKMFFHDW